MSRKLSKHLVVITLTCLPVLGLVTVVSIDPRDEGKEPCTMDAKRVFSVSPRNVTVLDRGVFQAVKDGITLVSEAEKSTRLCHVDSYYICFFR
jgi:hypothetical protein